MTHTGSMPDSAGEFKELGRETRDCRHCGHGTLHTVERWDSLDGAYVDHRFTCTVCGTVHWVDGIDS